MSRPGAITDDDLRARCYRFDDIVVDTAAQTLTRGGRLLDVEPKAFAVLLVLLRHAGELVERDALLDAVWGHRHVTPGVLTRAIAQLRAALGDPAQAPRYIQTRHALGYRFIGDLAAARTDAAEPAAPGPAPVATPATAHAPAGPRRSRSRAPWAAAALLAAAAALAPVAQRGGDAPASPAQASVAVLPFVNPGGDRGDDYFAEGLGAELRAALAGVEGLRVAAPLPPAAAPTGDTDLRTLGEALGVATVLSASVRREARHMRISARLADCASGFTLWSRTYEGAPGDVFAAQADIARAVVQALLGAEAARRAAPFRGLAPTGDLAAFDAYLLGLQQLRLAEVDGDSGSAADAFGRALAVDPAFARAQAGLCRTRVWRFVNLREAAAYDDARTACRLAEDMDPEAGAARIALGDLHRARGDLEPAAEAYRRAGIDPASAAAAEVGLAQVEAARGDHDAARAGFERALALQPGSAAIHGRLGYQQYLAGRLPEAIVSYRRALELAPEDAELWASLAGLHLGVGDARAAADALERSIRIRPTAIALHNYGELRFDAGDYRLAASLFRRALELEPGEFLTWGALGSALAAEPAHAGQAREAFRRAADMAAAYLALKPDDARALAALGWYRANLGERAQARGHLLAAEALGSDAGEVALSNAQTLVLVGTADEVGARLAAARAAGIAERRIATNPFLRRAPAVAAAAPDPDRHIHRSRP
ncbi:winged helix-turn-helix domain-containing protein [Coralloluteibacterium stylophorae]|uniref:Winged helix-turn-helix domain-containing protein n=3 Tax=Coralloluteibacterium stylophorae TaxID=1776034 RepID=A0A8J7VQV0_9GAMM|nr:winged helix-turn-helix domain-containing protein [Coralloluteibacterium stylophorae]MBS7456950.1 winged helix-turn-helix domain-containing protein [Coralloluteibacterium stylophorae]